MRRIDIIFADAVRESAIKTMVQRGDIVPDTFLGPSFVAKEGEVLGSSCRDGAYAVQILPDAKILHATPQPTITYVYPLHAINRIKETL